MSADAVACDGYYAIIVDETTDISTVEHVSMCIRHVDGDWNVSLQCTQLTERIQQC